MQGRSACELVHVFVTITVCTLLGPDWLTAWLLKCYSLWANLRQLLYPLNSAYEWTLTHFNSLNVCPSFRQSVRLSVDAMICFWRHISAFGGLFFGSGNRTWVATHPCKQHPPTSLLIFVRFGAKILCVSVGRSVYSLGSFSFFFSIVHLKMSLISNPFNIFTLWYFFSIRGICSIFLEKGYMIFSGVLGRFVKSFISSFSMYSFSPRVLF